MRISLPRHIDGATGKTLLAVKSLSSAYYGILTIFATAQAQMNKTMDVCILISYSGGLDESGYG